MTENEKTELHNELYDTVIPLLRENLFYVLETLRKVSRNKNMKCESDYLVNGFEQLSESYIKFCREIIMKINDGEIPFGAITLIEFPSLPNTEFGYNELK